MKLQNAASNCVFCLFFGFFTSICVSTHVAAFKYVWQSFKDGFSVPVYNLQQCDMLTSSFRPLYPL